MKLLDFQMPAYARVQYATKPLKEKWEAKVENAKQTFHTLEIETVKHGLRKCTTNHVPGNQLATAIAKFAQHGLVFVPIKRVGAYTGAAASHPEVVEGQAWNWYGVLAKDPKDAAAFVDASNTEEPDHKTIGKLLGYPDCCVDFFVKTWQEQGYIDPVWQQSLNTGEEGIKNKLDHKIRLRNSLPWELNQMLRYLNVRMVPHYTCSQDCEHSVKMAQEWIELGEKLNLKGIDDLKELLQLPVEWDALKGIAYVSTPIFKIETNTVACFPKHVVQREGTVFPEGAPRGLKFPFNEFMGIKINGEGAVGKTC